MATLFGLLLVAVCVGAATAKDSARLMAVGHNQCMVVGPSIPSISYGNLFTGDCDDIPANRWEVLDPTPGKEGGMIKNEAKGTCLAVHTNYADVLTWVCNDNDAQFHFNLISKGGEGQILKSVNTGLCVAVEDDLGGEGARIVTVTCHNEPRSQWVRIPKGQNIEDVKPEEVGVLTIT